MYNLFISHVISFLSLTYIGSSLLTLRHSHKYNLWISYVVIVIFLTLWNGDEISIYSTIYITIGYFIFLLYNFKSAFLKIMVVLVSFMVCKAMGEVLSANFMNLLTGLHSASDKTSFLFTIGNLLSEFITCLLSIAYVKMIKFSYWDKLPKYTYLLLVLPLSTMLLIVNIGDHFYILKNDWVLILTLVGLLFANFITIFIFLKTVSTLEVKKKLEIAEMEKRNSELRFKVLDNQYKANFTFMHDTIRSLIKLEKLLSQNDYDQFSIELQQLNTDMLRGINIVHSNSAMVSAIINFRLDDVLKYNIEFKSVIEYNDFSFLSSYEQRSIFDTLMDIGILNCKNTNNTEKLMILKTKRISNQVLIQLLCTYADSDISKLLQESYTNLKKQIQKHNGIISCERLKSNHADSIIISFHI